MQVSQIIENKLVAAFDPQAIEVVDDSESHRGHAGYREGGQTHFTVVIRADAFNGMSRVARQRAIHKVLTEELAGPVHALALKVEGTE